MTRIPGIRRLFTIDRGAPGVDGAIDDELGFHFAMTVKDLMRNGFSEDDARHEAERRFGNVRQTRERLASIDRERVGRQRRGEWFGAAAQDFRYALRGIRRSPGFTVAVVLTLGLGIGANAAMFDVVDRLLFRPPAYLRTPELMQRVYLNRTVQNREFNQQSIQYRRYLDLTSGTTSFARTAAEFYPTVAVGVADNAREMRVGAVSASLFQFFDAKPVVGRFFTGSEDLPPDGAPVAVLSNSYWQSAYGADRAVLGKRLQIGSQTYTIVGVAPDGFTGTAASTPAAFIPITNYASTQMSQRPGRRTVVDYHTTYSMSWMEMLAERKPGVSVGAATADLSAAFVTSYRSQHEQQPSSEPVEVAKPHAILAPILQERGPNQSSDAKVATWSIGVAIAVLLIACANVANLLVARALRRRREIAVRRALGVSQSRLISQLLIESLVLAGLGAVAGLAAAQWGGAFLRTAFLSNHDTHGLLTDGRTLAFTGVAALVVALLTGIAPALQAGRSDVAATLKAGAREGTMQRSRLRVALLIVQGALSVMLLVGAGLFVRSLHTADGLHLGYDVDDIAFVEPALRGMALDSAGDVNLRERLLQAAQALPGVAAAARAVTVPFYMEWDEDIFVPTLDTAKINAMGSFEIQAVSPDYFTTMRTRILDGRGFTAEDRAGAPGVMVVSDAMAKALWPGERALGKCVKIGSDTVPCRTVIGVAETTRTQGLDKDPGLAYYLPIGQWAPRNGGLFVRVNGNAADHAESLRRGLQTLMPGVAYVTATPLAKYVAPERRSWRLGAMMFTVFGGLALLLAAVGLYSVIAYNVTQRTHELGVRVALGAQRQDVMRLVMRDGLVVAVIGVAVGSALALGAAQWIEPLLFHQSARDPVVFVSVGALMLLVAVAASLAPALRATRVDPATALRTD